MFLGQSQQGPDRREREKSPECLGSGSCGGFGPVDACWRCVATSSEDIEFLANRVRLLLKWAMRGFSLGFCFIGRKVGKLSGEQGHDFKGTS